MTDPNTQASRVAVANARALKRRLRWNNDAVAERINRTGYRITAATTRFLLGGRRKSITLDEAVALAVAFGMGLEALLTELCPECDGIPPAYMRCTICGAVNEPDDFVGAAA